MNQKFRNTIRKMQTEEKRLIKKKDTKMAEWIHGIRESMLIGYREGIADESKNKQIAHKKLFLAFIKEIEKSKVDFRTYYNYEKFTPIKRKYGI